MSFAWNSNSRMAGKDHPHRSQRFGEWKKSRCQTTQNCHEEVWGCTLCGADVFFLILLRVLWKKLFWTGLHKAIKLQLRTLRRNVWCEDIEKWVTVEGELFRKRYHQALHAHFGRWLSHWPRWPGQRSILPFEHSRAPTKPNFQRPERAGQRCQWRLVCEWVCTVASVSVRIEKRTNCAKNNKPISGELFLVNARPFPEQSSSIATCRVGSI